MTDQIMETLTNEEHERLLLMSEHAIAPPLSAAAQAVLDAANGANSYGPDDCLNESRWIAAAALQAAAGVITFPGPESLLAIAAELEAHD